MGSEFDRVKALWAQAQWAPDESKKKELAHQIIAAFDALLAADDLQLNKAQRAAAHNLRGLAYAMLGGAEHLQLARVDYKRALKLNRRLRQASNNLKEVNKALYTRDAAAKRAKLEQRRLKYCCGCVPRCKKGPWKPKPKTVDLGGPAFAKLQKKTHLVMQAISLTSVVAGADSSTAAAPMQPPQISWAWPDSGFAASESKKKEPDRDILLAIERCKLGA